MDRIAIIVPCYNEEEVLAQFYRAVEEVIAGVEGCRFQYCFVNDGSRDGTLAILRRLAEEDPKVSYLSFTRNFGKEAAMLAGLDYVDCDAAVIMDADLQHPPEMIPDMISWWRRGYDDVCGKRIDRQDEGFVKRLLTNCFYNMLKKSSRTDMQRNVGDFRLLDRRCIAALRLLREEERYTKGMFSWVGYRKKEIPFRVHPRAAGRTTWNYWSLFNLAVEGLTSFTAAPLRFSLFCGAAVTATSFLYILYALLAAALLDQIMDIHTAILTAVLFMGGLQLLALGIIGEYLGRVFNESKRRPLYLVDEWNGRKVEYIPEPLPKERMVAEGNEKRYENNT